MISGSSLPRRQTTANSMASPGNNVAIVLALVVCPWSNLTHVQTNLPQGSSRAIKSTFYCYSSAVTSF